MVFLTIVSVIMALPLHKAFHIDGTRWCQGEWVAAAGHEEKTNELYFLRFLGEGCQDCDRIRQQSS